MSTEPRIAAIPTTYNGVNFRSRLEARWAAFFDAAGWRWSYEPVDLDGWIPDFVLHLKEPIYVEVKPALTEAELREHCAKIDAAQPEHEVLLLGADVGIVPDPLNSGTSLGLLCELSKEIGPDGIERLQRWWDAAGAFECSCGPAFAHVYGLYSCRVCNRGRVDRSDGHDWPLQAMRHASNSTQWRPR
jgi:hypothetical protein